VTQIQLTRRDKLTVPSLVTAWGQSGFGETGIFALTALVGASDIDPFVLSLAQAVRRA